MPIVSLLKVISDFFITIEQELLTLEETESVASSFEKVLRF
jgi:hypothetical protein